MKKYENREQLLKEINNNRKFELRGGAGSGKTSALLDVLDAVSSTGKKILAISFTNAAKDEMIKRFGQHENLEVRTIHSFFRKFCKENEKDFIDFLKNNIDEIKPRSLTDLEEKLGRKIEIQKFGFSGEVSFEEQIELNTLYISHHYTLEFASKFFLYNKDMYGILDSQYDVILIDEYQDTNIEIVKLLTSDMISNTSVGFFGDLGQRIYQREMIDFSKVENVASYYKDDNFRSSSILVNFFNNFRDDFEQIAKNNELKDYESKIVVYKNTRNTIDEIKKIEGELEIKFDKVLHLKNRDRLENIHPGAFDKIHVFNDDPNVSTATFSKMTADHVKFICKIKQFVDPDFIEDDEFWVIERDDQTGEVIMVRDDKRKIVSEALANLVDKIKEMNSLESALEIAKILDGNSKAKKEFDFFMPKETIPQLTNEIFRELDWEIYEKLYLLYKGYYPNSTIHSVKGMEFDNVAIYLESGGWRVYNFEKYFSDSTFDKEESRKWIEMLFYVGITRAKKNLVLIIENEEYLKLQELVNKNNLELSLK